MTDTDLRQPDATASAAQALIDEARRVQRRRRRHVLAGLTVAVLLVGAAVSAAYVRPHGGPKPSSTQPTTRVGHPAAAPRPTAYITTSAGILEVNLATRTIVRRIIPNGSRLALLPIAIAPGGHTAYAVSDNVLTRIDLDTGRADASITYGPATGGRADATGFPAAIVIAPNGETAYIAVPAYGTIVPVQLMPLSAGKPIDVGGTPFAIALAPDALTAYVPNSSSSAIDVVNLATDAVESPITGVDDPHEIVIAPNGRIAYVSAGGIDATPSVVPIDLATRRVAAPIALDARGRAYGYVPGPMTLSADGRVVYVAAGTSETTGVQITMLSTVTNRVIDRVGGLSGPIAMALVGATHTLYVLNAAASGDGGITLGSPRSAIDENALVPVNPSARKVGLPIALPASPRAMAVAPS